MTNNKLKNLFYFKRMMVMVFIMLLMGGFVVFCNNSSAVEQLNSTKAWAEQKASGYGSHGHATGSYGIDGHYGKSYNNFKYFNADNHKMFVEQDQYFTNNGVYYKKDITSTEHKGVAKGVMSPTYSQSTQVIFDNNYTKTHARMFFVLDIPSRKDIMSPGVNTVTHSY
jgi:lipopolysaccharide export LptBFGC system permease protein LptF